MAKIHFFVGQSIEEYIIMVTTSQTDFVKDKSYFLNLMIGKFILPAIKEQ